MIRPLLIAAALLAASPAFGQTNECEATSLEYSHRRAYFAENLRLVLLYAPAAQGGMTQYFNAWYAALEQGMFDGKAMMALRLSAPECFFDGLSTEKMREALADLEQKFATAKREGFR